MRQYLYFLLACAIMLPLFGTAQTRSCGTHDHMEQLLQSPDYRRNHLKRINKFQKFSERIEDRALCSNPVVLPMAIHFQNVPNPDAACLIALAQDQVNILNNDYHGTNSDISNWINNASSSFPGLNYGETCVEFCIATQNHPSGYGLSNGQPAVTINQTSGDFNSNWAGYINVFVQFNTGVLGYSPLGGNGNGDGVVIDASAFGSGPGCGAVVPGAPYNLGRTLTHELGHYLLLDHIWGPGGSNTNNCNDSDNVGDTPNQSRSYGGCPSIGAASCGSTDLHMNYMDYTNDACMYMFSAGQSTRMENYVSSNLSNLVNNASVVCGSGPPPPTCTDGVQNGQETGVDCGGPSCPPCQSNCTLNEVNLTIVLDNYGSETTWQFRDANNALVASGGPYSDNANGTIVSDNFCFADGCYTFTIFDSYGDGICCGYGNGSYSVTDGSNNVLASGGSFGSSESTNFCFGGTPPTCTDGVQNGQETGVDCGGPTCPACPTCDDGIQNGNETGVDCGGDCAPCGGGGGCTTQTVAFDNFDSNWGTWNDGGGDCARVRSTTWAFSGDRSIRLRDNSGMASSMFTDNLNLAGYEEVTIDFTYITNSMDNANEDFWLDVSTDGGASYFAVEEWNLNDEFVNNVRYFDAVTLVGTFTSNTRFRFRCDASANGDQVYIDDVLITGCTTGAREVAAREEIQPIQNSWEAEPSLQLFPNPTSDVLNVEFELPTDGNVQLTVTDYTGKTVRRVEQAGVAGVQRWMTNAKELSAGFYFVHMVYNGKTITRKFVVTH